MMVCDRPSESQQRDGLWTVEIEQRRTPIINTIAVIDPRDIDRRFENGDLCFYVHDGIRCLGFTWGHTGDCYIRGAATKLTLEPHSVYLYSVYTLEEVRRRGIYDAIQKEFFRYYKKRQVTRIYTMIEKDNHIMKQVFLRSGFRIKSNIHCVRYHKVGVRYVYDYEDGKMAVQFITREPGDCVVI
ncbi:MAG: GNAT family N-acetyltransferase [Syntrophaceae bacterium]|nr:GNAT family N-acetyltransferase [Syntrophaceae bacterium]